MYPDIEYVLRKRYLLTIVYRSGVMLLVVLGLLPGMLQFPLNAA